MTTSDHAIVTNALQRVAQEEARLMPMDRESGLVEPDIVINGLALTFAECLAVRVAVGSYRLSLASRTMRTALGTLASHYDHHLASVERAMLRRHPDHDVELLDG